MIHKQYKSIPVSVPYVDDISDDDVFYDELEIGKIHMAGMIVGYAAIYTFIGFNGVFDEPKMLHDIELLKTRLGLSVPGIFYVFISEKENYIYNSDIEHLIVMDNDMFANIYTNMRHAFNPLQLSFSEIVETREFDQEINENIGVNYIDQLIETLNQLIAEKEEENLKFFYDDDGNKYAKHGTNAKLKIGKNGSVKIPYISQDEWFRVDSTDPFKLLIMTVFGGWFGLHKFQEGNKALGRIYLLTCGGFGVMYILDVFSLVTGTAYRTIGHGSERERIYYDRVDNFWINAGMFLISMVIAYFAVNVIYKSLFQLLLSIIYGA